MHHKSKIFHELNEESVRMETNHLWKAWSFEGSMINIGSLILYLSLKPVKFLLFMKLSLTCSLFFIILGFSHLLLLFILWTLTPKVLLTFLLCFRVTRHLVNCFHQIHTRINNQWIFFGLLSKRCLSIV